jgi:hypothetical protein
MACTALIRPARTAIPSATRPVRASMASGTVMLAQVGTAKPPTPYTCAVWPSIGDPAA